MKRLLLLLAALLATPALAQDWGTVGKPAPIRGPGLFYTGPDGFLYAATGDTGGHIAVSIFGTPSFSCSNCSSGGGAVTIANGADVVEGNNTDAAGAPSVFGMAKGIYGYEASRSTTPQRTSANAGDYASGYSPDLGTPADTAYAGSGNGSSISVAKGIYVNTTNLLKAGGIVRPQAQSGDFATCSIYDIGCGASPNANTVTADLLLLYARQALQLAAEQAIQTRSAYVNEVSNGSLSANQGANGATRDAGVANSNWAKFECEANVNGTGATLYLQASNDNTTFYNEWPGVALTAGSPAQVIVPINTRWHRCQLVNPNALTQVFLNSALLAN